MTRHEIREASFILLYEKELNDDTVEELADATTESFEMPVSKEIISFVTAVSEKKEELDSYISQFSPTRAVNRIAKINLIILRIAIYEMKYCENVPNKVAVNEAIELAKAYSDKKDAAFINGVLNSCLKSMEENA